MSNTSQVLNQVADLLEKMAAHEEATTQQQLTIKEAATKETAQQLREKLAAVTGEDIPEDTLAGILRSNTPAAEVLTKLASRQERELPVLDMGGPSDDLQPAKPSNRREKVAAASNDADAQLLNWIMSD